MGAAVCNNCGGHKPEDRYRACPDCRADWRHARRKPDGPAATIDKLRAELARLQARIAELELQR